ncbi:hypothetical protein CS379_17665, partial [Methylobacterium frigidaeris]
MDAVIARYLPEIASGSVPPQAARGQAPEAFGDPWAGLARAPRAPAPLPVADAPDAIRVEPVRTDHPPAGLPDDPLGEWHEGLLPRAAKPTVPTPLAATPSAAEPAIAGSPLIKPASAKRETPEERAALLAAAEERGRQQGLAEAREEAEIARLRA